MEHAADRTHLALIVFNLDPEPPHLHPEIGWFSLIVPCRSPGDLDLTDGAGPVVAVRVALKDMIDLAAAREILT